MSGIPARAQQRSVLAAQGLTPLRLPGQMVVPLQRVSKLRKTLVLPKQELPTLVAPQN